jgi:hypothetical protein
MIPAKTKTPPSRLMVWTGLKEKPPRPDSLLWLLAEV